MFLPLSYSTYRYCKQLIAQINYHISINFPHTTIHLSNCPMTPYRPTDRPNDRPSDRLDRAHSRPACFAYLPPCIRHLNFAQFSYSSAYIQTLICAHMFVQHTYICTYECRGSVCRSSCMIITLSASDECSTDCW